LHTSRQHSKKIKGSSNRERARKNLVRKNEDISNRRRDWFWKLAHELTDKFDVLCFETLNLKGMQHLWGRKISDLAFGEFLQILVARSQKGSNNRIKARKKVALSHRKITNCREDFLHKLSRRIVNENQVIVVENLNVKGMMHQSKLAKSIHQVRWGMFCTMLKYKAERSGKIYFEVDRFFPSSKTCHVCLN